MKPNQLKKAISSAFSLLLVMIMIFSISVPHVLAQSNTFAGTGDLEVGEKETVDLLQGVAATSPIGENLQVTVKNVICETNGNYQYDGSGVLDAGSAGSIYRIEYEATSTANAEEVYSTTRKITVFPSENLISEEAPETFAEEITETTSEKMPETLPEEITEEVLETLPEENTEEFTDGSTEEFDENVPFTLSDLTAMGYSVQMETAKIPIENFELQCLSDAPDGNPCKDLHFAEDITTIDGGKIKEHVPSYLMNSDNKLHSYAKAHVGNVLVYYMGILHITHGDDTTEDYVYYTTDTQITNKTVYAVLKKAEAEKITLEYSHDSDYRVEYKMVEKDVSAEGNGPDGWSYNDVFGEHRATDVQSGQEIGVSVKIPRGYQAKVTVTRNGNTSDDVRYLGKMLAYERDQNRINLKQDSPTRMIYETSFNVKDIKSDVVITLEYFVLGDHRTNAKDSRIYGTVKKEEIKGSVITLLRRRGF